MKTSLLKVAYFALIGAAIWAVLPPPALAHCDTMDGPVIKDARTALEKADITPVLKWVKSENEPEIRTAFDKTLAVGKQGSEAKELAEMYFFETLVRLHRAGEGAPYTGLKPAGTAMEPAVAEADRALAAGTADSLVKMINEAAAVGLRQRFARAVETAAHANESIAAGRAFVQAYVQFVHYAEKLALLSQEAVAEEGHSGNSEAEHKNH